VDGADAGLLPLHRRAVRRIALVNLVKITSTNNASPQKLPPVYTYTYDLAGNGTSVQVNGGTPTTYNYNAANQVTNTGWSYDNAGNLTAEGTTTYSYDALNRLTARETTTYAYNGDGTLVSQTANSITARYTQDLAVPLNQVLRFKSVGARRPTASVVKVPSGPSTMPAHSPRSAPRCLGRRGARCRYAGGSSSPVSRLASRVSRLRSR
jgi:YD repeat-containing protein